MRYEEAQALGYSLRACARFGHEDQTHRLAQRRPLVTCCTNASPALRATLAPSVTSAVNL